MKFTNGMKKAILTEKERKKTEATREFFEATIQYPFHSQKRRRIATELQYMTDKEWVLENYPELVVQYIL